MYAQVNGLSLAPVIEQIARNQDIHSYQTRGMALSHVKYMRTEIVSNSFTNISSIYWASLPRHITSSNTLSFFNSRHKKKDTCSDTQTMVD